MMKRIRSIIAVTMCASMCACACSPRDSADKPEESVVSETEDVKKDAKKDVKKEKKYQKKLDMIQPSAYDNIMGLKLEKGAAISVIGKAEGVPYWEEVKKGAEQAVEDINENLGYDGKDRVKVTYSAPGTPDSVDEQVNILDEELARYPVALGIAITDVNACEVQFDLAAESDIPVVAFDSGSAYQGLMAMVSTDNQAAAKEAAVRLAELADESGEIILFIHDSKSESAMSRENAFKEEIEENHPEISIAEIYYMDQLGEMQKKVAAEKNGETQSEDDGAEAGEEPADDSASEETENPAADTVPEEAENPAADTVPEEAGENQTENQGEDEGGANDEDAAAAELLTEEEVIDHILAKHPNVKGFYATNGEAVMLTVEAMERNEIEAAVVGYDADQEEIDALADGKVDALVLQNPFGMGYATIIAAARAALSMGNEAVVDTGYTWLTRESLEDEAIQKLMY